MKRTHRFRIIESTWGVAIDLTAHLVSGQPKLESDKQLPNLVFARQDIDDAVRNQAQRGLDSVASTFPKAAAILQNNTLVVDDICYNPCDFQAEGIACATAEWICLELGLFPVPLKLRFDKCTKQYVLCDLQSA